MCGVIVVDAGRSQSTNLGRDAYIMDHCLDIVMIIWSSINCPTIICSPSVCYFSREKPLVKPTAPGSLSHIICLRDLFYLPFIFRSIKPKIQKYLAAIYFIWSSIYQSTTIYSRLFANFWRRYPKGIGNPFNTSGCEDLLSMCRVGYVVLLGSPSGSITLVSHLREIPTATMLHRPFLFWEIST